MQVSKDFCKTLMTIYKVLCRSLWLFELGKDLQIIQK